MFAEGGRKQDHGYYSESAGIVQLGGCEGRILKRILIVQVHMHEVLSEMQVPIEKR